MAAFHDTGINPYHEVFRNRRPLGLRAPLDLHPRLSGGRDRATDHAAGPDDPTDWAERRQGGLRSSGRAFSPASCTGSRARRSSARSPSAQPWTAHATAFRPPAPRSSTTTATARWSPRAGPASGYGACRESDCRIVAVQSPMSVNLVNPASRTRRRSRGSTSSPTTRAGSTSSRTPGDRSFRCGNRPARQGCWPPTRSSLGQSSEPPRAHPAFWASGNGIAFRGGVLGHPTVLTPHLGPSGYHRRRARLGLREHLARLLPSRRFGLLRRVGREEQAPSTTPPTTSSGGTSGATPYAAGGAGRILLEARRDPR